MSLFVDTGVWSLAFRRDAPASVPAVDELVRAVDAGEPLLTTGIVVQELLQGFAGPRDRLQLLQRFAMLPLLVPDRLDHTEAARLKNACRHHGVQIGTIEALLAQLCLRHDLTMLTTDDDFQRVADLTPLKVWG